MVLQQFKDKYLGKQVEFHSYGTGAFNQCVDLVNQYINEVLDSHTKDYTEIIGTNAKDFKDKYDREDFEWIANTPQGVPQAGDIVVWNGRVGGGAGHVAIFLEGDVNSFRSLDQNWSQVERVTLENHNYSNVSGWLRPKNYAESGTQVSIDSKTFETLVDKSTKYDSFAAGGYSSIDDVLKKIKEKDEEVSGRDEEIKKLSEQVLELKKLNTQLIKTFEAEEEKDNAALEIGIDAQHERDNLRADLESVAVSLGLDHKSPRKAILEAITQLNRERSQVEDEAVREYLHKRADKLFTSFIAWVKYGWKVWRNKRKQ